MTIDFYRSTVGPLMVALLLTMFQLSYVFADVVPSPAAALICTFALPVSVLAWVESDARIRHTTPCWDFGLFILLTFPVSILGYLFCTRGWTGLLVALYFLALAMAPSMVAETIWTVRSQAGL